MADTKSNHLKELGESKYEIVSGESDIRGWTVKNDSGRIIGRVNDLIIDTTTSKIRYFLLDTEGNELYMASRRVLLPLEHAELDEVYKNVIFPRLTAHELSALPTYDKNTLNSRSEEIIQSAFRNFNAGRYKEDESNTIVPGAAVASANDSFDTTGYRNDQDYETRYTDQYEDDAVRHQSVAGVFENRDHADVAISRLIENGFHRRDIHMSYRDRDEISRGDLQENESISSFFSNFFNSDESNWLNSDEGRKYPVVIVNRLSIAEAERAAEILDRFGALNIDESLQRYQSGQQALQNEKRYRSRIIGL